MTTTTYKTNVDTKYLSTCIQFFHIWAVKCKTPVFYKNPPSYEEFLNKLNSMDEETQFSYLVESLKQFQKESENKNPLDLLFSQMTNWNINFHLVIKEFIPYVIRLAPHVKFKRAGCILQTNNHFYLFSEVFKQLIVQYYKNNNITNQESLEDLITVYLGIRYRQIHGEKDYTHYEDKFLNAYNKAMEELNESQFSDFKVAFSSFREKMLKQRITNENLFNSLKAFQNILGKNAMSSTKKETFFWQMYADLKCIDKLNYITPFQEKFFLQIQYSSDNKIYIVFNKEYFKAMKQVGLLENIGSHRIVYIYILYNLHKKLKENYSHDYGEKGTPFVEALRSADPIFENFNSYIEDMEKYFKTHTKEISLIYPQLIEVFNSKFFLDDIKTLNSYVEFGLKEQLNILDYVDRKKLYKPYL